MDSAGSALMGIGEASGDNRAVEAAQAAVSSPLLEMSIEGAKGVVFTISGGPGLTMHEVSEAAEAITASADADARIIFGSVIDDNLKDQLKVTVIATGFDKRIKPAAPQKTSYEPTPFVKQKEVEETKKPEPKKPLSASDEATPERKFPFTKKAADIESPKPKKPASEEDQEDLEIPAFIRKKMM
jgi:cell division protein FtsZ